jgi:hypothetical protein
VLFPFFELIAESDRAQKSALLSTEGALRFRDWLALIVPPHDGFVPDVEAQMLVGLPVLGMAFAALQHWRSSRTVRALTSLVIIPAILASSLPEWLHRFIAAVIPGFAAFRLHGRLSILVVFALLLLAGSWLSNIRAPRWLIATSGGLTALILLMALPALKHWYLMPANYPMEPFMPGLVRELKAATAAPVPPRINISARHVRENSGMLTGFSTFNGYVSLHLARVWEYIHLAAGLPPPPTMITFPDVQIFYRDPFIYPSMNLVAGFDTRAEHVRLNPMPDPRAYLCFNAERVHDWHEVIRRMVDGHDFHRTALVEVPLQALGVEGRGTVKIVGFENEKVDLQTEADAPAIMVLAEAWYPGWEAEVNGRPANAFPVNGWMRGVAVPAGKAEVTWRYRSRYFPAGCIAGGLAFAFLLLLLRRKQ